MPGLVVGQLFKSNRFVRLSAGAERTGWTAEEFAPIAHERNGSHIGVKRASAGLTGSHLCRLPHPPARVAEAQGEGQHNTESKDLLCAAHRAPSTHRNADSHLPDIRHRNRLGAGNRAARES